MSIKFHRFVWALPLFLPLAMLALAERLTTVLDYSLFISLTEFGFAVAILLAAMAWKRTRKRIREREDRWLLTQIALFVLSGVVLIAFNLANTNTSDLQSPIIADTWVFYLGIILFGFALVPLAPLCFITFYPKSRLPNKVVSLVREGMGPALKTMAISALVILGYLDLASFITDLQEFLLLWGHVNLQFSFVFGLILSSFAVGVVGTGALALPFLNRNLDLPKKANRVALVMFILPYTLLAALEILYRFGINLL